MPDPVYGQPITPGEIVADARERLGALAEPLERLGPELLPGDKAELWSAIRHLAKGHAALQRLADRLFTREHPASQETRTE